MNVIQRRHNGVMVEYSVNGVPQPLEDAGPTTVKKFSGAARAVPVKEWPMWAKALKLIAKPEDKGIGDVVARMIGAENSAAFKAWHLATFGKSCGCTGRQARWNRQYPLN